jgi:hypothetical protein
MKKGIQQTTEAVTALLALLVSTAKAKADDGRVSRPEAVGLMLGNAGALWTAASGISEVPPELADLDPEELDKLMRVVLASRAWEADDSKTDIVMACYDSVRQLLATVRRIENTIYAKKAVIVEESALAEGGNAPHFNKP